MKQPEGTHVAQLNVGIARGQPVARKGLRVTGPAVTTRWASRARAAGSG